MRVENADVRIFREPEELFFCVNAGVFGYAGYCCLAVHSAVEHGEEFFVAYGVERV